MPGVRKIQKEEIINAAVDIIRESGIESLQARTIAKRLNCSTQPIFYQFANMEELKKEVFKKITDIYTSYLTIDSNMSHQYKESGKGYIRFAKEEPKLFSIMLMSENDCKAEKLLVSNREVYKNILKYVMEATGIKDEEKARKFHLKMWIFTHGIATMIATKTCDISNEEISNMLTDEFKALMLLERGEKSE